MAETSSTSSSNLEDLPPGLPKAFLLSIAIVLVVEIFIRVLGPRRMNPYALGENEYDAVAAALADEGPAEISFVGTSREREAIVLPMVRETLTVKLGHPVSVASYATAGARAAEIDVIVEAMLERGKPSLVMYGVQPRTLLGNAENPSRMATFWGIADYQRYHAIEPDRYGTALIPNVIRTEFSSFYHTLRYRPRPSAMVLDLYEVLAHPGRGRSVKDVLLLEPIPSPVFGEITFWQRSNSGVSLATRPVSEERVDAYVQSVMENGRYEFTPRKIAQLSRTVQRLQQAHVPVVLFEVPISDILERHLPAGTMANFRRILEQITIETGVRYVSLERLGMTFDDSDFLEQSHMNQKGAKRLTRVLTEKVIVPALETGQR